MESQWSCFEHFVVASLLRRRKEGYLFLSFFFGKRRDQKSPKRERERERERPLPERNPVDNHISCITAKRLDLTHPKSSQHVERKPRATEDCWPWYPFLFQNRHQHQMGKRWRHDRMVFFMGKLAEIFFGI
jgi:hypothetical protein